MWRTVSKYALIGLLVCRLAAAGAAELPAGEALTVINAVEYSAEDFQHWWENVQKAEEPLPAEAEEFINWQLLVQEANKMELFTLPSFQHKVEVFVKVRALMMLKNQEVDSRITISETEMRELYHKEYVPGRYLAELHFKKFAEAQETFLKLSVEKPGYAELFKYAGHDEQPLFLVRHPKWYRPALLPEQVAKAVTGLQPGDFSKPFQVNNGFVVYQLLKLKEGEPEDFELRKNDLRENLRKKKHSELTEELINKLKKKYNVTVNEQLLVALDILSPDPRLADEILVTSARSKVDVAYFMAQFKRNPSLMHELTGGPDQQLRIKWRTLNAMVSNSLVDWEALDRHYEKEAPFKPVYQFYRQHRLIVELKNRIYQDLTVTTKELQDYYQQHAAEFTEPAKVRLTYIQGEEQEIKALWSESLIGRDLMKVSHGMALKIVYGANQTHNHHELSGALRDKLASLGPGEVSMPFVDEGTYSLARLEEVIPSLVPPFEQVKDLIAEKLIKAKRDEALKSFLAQLREHSSIYFNDKVWSAMAAKQVIQ